MLYLYSYSSQKRLKLRYLKTQSATHQQALERLKQLLSQAQSTRTNPFVVFRALNQIPAAEHQNLRSLPFNNQTYRYFPIFTESLLLHTIDKEENVRAARSESRTSLLVRNHGLLG
jgi:hypothetical protein